MTMKLDKSQSGFSHLLILLTVIVLGFIGLVGWKVFYINRRAIPNNDSVLTNNHASLPINPGVSSVPTGFMAYKNKELGLKFAYPKEWGTANEQPIEPSDPKYEAEYGNRNPLTELKFSLLGPGS